jgi:hypothetical protein
MERGGERERERENIDVCIYMYGAIPQRQLYRTVPCCGVLYCTSHVYFFAAFLLVMPDPAVFFSTLAWAGGRSSSWGGSGKLSLGRNLPTFSW